MDIRTVKIWPLVWRVQIWDFWFQPPSLCETQSDDLCMCASYREAWMRRCDGALLVTRLVINLKFKAHNQHGYHSILQWYAIPSGLRLVWLWPNPSPGCVRASWPRRRVMECCIRWLGPHNHPTSNQLRWFGMSWAAEWRRSSQQVLSICGNSFKLFQVKHSRWSWLRECQARAKLSSRQRVATLKNLKYKICFDLINTFLVTTWFHMCYFIVLMTSLSFYNEENSQNKENEYVCPNFWLVHCILYFF